MGCGHAETQVYVDNPGLYTLTLKTICRSLDWLLPGTMLMSKGCAELDLPLTVNSEANILSVLHVDNTEVRALVGGV